MSYSGYECKRTFVQSSRRPVPPKLFGSLGVDVAASSRICRASSLTWLRQMPMGVQLRSVSG